MNIWFHFLSFLFFFRVFCNSRFLLADLNTYSMNNVAFVFGHESFILSRNIAVRLNCSNHFTSACTTRSGTLHFCQSRGLLVLSLSPIARARIGHRGPRTTRFNPNLLGHASRSSGMRRTQNVLHRGSKEFAENSRGENVSWVGTLSSRALLIFMDHLSLSVNIDVTVPDDAVVRVAFLSSYKSPSFPADASVHASVPRVSILA